MEQKHVGLILQLVIVALLAVIAFELAQQPHPVDPTGDINDVSSQVQALDKDVQGLSTQVDAANNYLSKEITYLDGLLSSVSSLARDVSTADGFLKSICQNTGPMSPGCL